jgi:adenylate cyclase
MERRLAAILAADVVGYSRLMGEDETGTLDALRAHREELIEPKIAEHEGRVVKLMGDGLLAEFPSAVEAVHCAVEIQHTMGERNANVPAERRITYRIGINIGDIIVEGDDIYGDGVNIAARLEGLADPGGISISRSVHTQIAGKLDLEIEDLGEQQVKNIAKPVMVYRVALDESAAALVTPVTVTPPTTGRRRWPQIAAGLGLSLVAVVGLFWWQASAPDFEPASVEKMAYPLPGKPSIAVLPFANLGNDSEQEYFADGITNDLITDLTKFDSLFVIAANSTFAYKGKPVKVQKVAEDLGVRYVLEGSVQRVGDTIRINAQLIDAVSGHHLWADRYDRKADDLFAIQNEIIKIIIGTLNLQVKDAENERAFKTPTDDLEAYDYYQRGYAYFRAWGKENNAKAREMYERAIEIDPQYARAYADLAFVHARHWRYDWIEDTSGSLALSLEHARKAVALDPDDYFSYWALGHAYLANGESDLSLTAYERALALNPNDPALLMEMGELLVSLGQAEQAVARAKTAMRRNPRHPDWYLWNLGWAQYFAEQHDEAVTTLQKMTEPPNLVRRTLAAALVRVGRIDEAREMITEYMKNEPEQTVADIRKIKYKHRPYVDKWAEDLLEAGLPE